MKYTPEITQLIVRAYESGKTAKEIAEQLSNMGTETSETLETCSSLGSGTDSQKQTSAEQTKLSTPLIVPERSVIAKLSSLGIYKKKEYLTKRGETPIKKEEYIERIAALLDVNSDLLESLEKVNKSVLALLEQKLK